MATRLRPSITDALAFLPGIACRKPNRPEAAAVIHRMHKIGPNRGAALWADGTYSVHGMTERQFDRFIEFAADDPLLYPVGAAAIRVRHVEELAAMTRIENYLRDEAASGTYDPWADERGMMTV